MGQSPCLPWKREAEDGEPSVRSRLHPRRVPTSVLPEDPRDSQSRGSSGSKISRDELTDRRALPYSPAYSEDIFTDPPFSQKIMQESIPSNFKLSQFESYDGISDPIDHLKVFQTMMLLDALDAILCRAFPSTLKGAVRNWYSTLKLGTIFSFDQISHQFMAHFISG